MGSRTEKDYDSATPALQQQMNLARRACWTHRALWPIEPTLSPHPNSSPRQCSALPTNGAIASQAANPRKPNRNEDEEQRSRRPRRRQMANSSPLRVLLLCGICMWFACCEARPNVSASSSTVSSSATASSAGPTDAVTQLNVSALN